MSQKERIYTKIQATLPHQPDEANLYLLNYTSLLSIGWTKNKQQIFSFIWNKISSKAKKRSTQARAFWLTAAAASILLFITIITYEHIPQCRIATNSVQRIILPDGSSADLKKGSKLSYYPYEWHKERHVTLQGEAFFKVVKGTTFKVETAQAHVTVLGTSFIVKSYDNTFNLHCYTGKVSVKQKNGDFKALIQPGEAALLTKGKWHYATFSPKQYPQWLTKSLQFSHQQLNEVFTCIEKRFNVKITHPDFSDRYYTGTIKSHNLDNLMQIICYPMNLTYKLVNKREIEISCVTKNTSYERD
ncbi:FecR family protein [Marinilabiliaceae bacterium JC017]|nr:FecR family protein [Marinilabiliaceae bacterium JC017]